MNLGQMVEDVKISVADKAAVHFHGRPGGVVSTPHEIADAMTRLIYRHELQETNAAKQQLQQELKPTTKARKKKRTKVPYG
jgi:hypothetical protein